MHLLVDLMHKGGPFMWLLLLVFISAFVPVVLGAVMLGLRRWVPSALFWLAPLGLILFGAVGRIQGQIMASEAVMHASMEVKSTLLHAGLGVAAYTELSGYGMAAMVLALSAPVVGVCLMAGAGPEARWRPLPAVAGVGAGFIAAIAAAAVAMVQPWKVHGAGGELLLLPGLLVIGGLALGLSALRGSDHEADAGRLAAGRLSVGALVLGSVLCAVAAGSLHGYTVLHEAMAHASAETRMSLMALGILGLRSWWLPGAAGLLLLSSGAVITGLGGVRHASGSRFIVSGGVTVLALLVTLAAPAYANFQAWQLGEMTTERHLGRQLALMPDIPRAVALGTDNPEPQPQAGYWRSVVRQGSDWTTGSAFAGPMSDWRLPQTPEDADALLVVAPPELPAALITDTTWVQAAGEPHAASLLVAVDHGQELVAIRSPWLASAGTGMLQLDVVPHAAWPAGDDSVGDLFLDVPGDVDGWRSLVFIEDTPEGLVVHDYTQSMEAGTALEDAFRESQKVLEGGKPAIVLIPGSDWTLQDVVSHCLSADAALPEVYDDERYYYDPPVRCGLTDAVPEGLMAARQSWHDARSGFGGLGSRGSAGGTAMSGDFLILGSLDKTVIQAVIQRHLNQIRYCYQRELTKDPDLGGRVVIKFVVAKDGTVSSATVKSTTMYNDAVESCIAGRFMRFQFPEPAGGGIVIVSYPFVFTPAG